MAATMLIACDAEPDALFTDDTTETPVLYDYYIDEYGNEGVVVYNMDKTSKYAIVMSLDESLQSWGPMGEMVYGVDSIRSTLLSNHSYGVAMHQAMKARGINRYPAQAWCDQKNGGEKYARAGSWRLPSYYEWGLIINRLSKINTAMTEMGGTPLDDSHHYWVCDEDYVGRIKINGTTSDYDCENRAVVTSPTKSTYGNKDRWLKKNKYYVRAIKYIYYEY